MFKNLTIVVFPLCLATISLTAQSPPVVSPDPIISGSGAMGTFTFSASDPDGTGDLNSVAIVVNSSLTEVQSCYARYFPSSNQLFLQKDDGTGWTGNASPGAATGLGNQQCWINLQLSSVSSGSSLTITLMISFQPNFNGAKNVWIEAHDNENHSSDWQPRGSWTATPQINIAAPIWTEVMTAAPTLRPEYLKYESSGATELPPALNPDQHFPHDFLQPASADTNGRLSGVCKYPDASTGAPPFWWVGGVHKGGDWKNTIPSEYFVTPFTVPGSAYTDIGFGLQFQGSFGGEASGSGSLVETAFLHQQPCYAGQMEYGFYRSLVKDPMAPTFTIFYFSNNSNCGNEGTPNPPLCHVADDINSATINEDTPPGVTAPQPHGYGISNIKVGGVDATHSNLFYSAYIVPDTAGPNGYRFQVEVFDPATYAHATCDVLQDPGIVVFTGQLCSFPVYPAAWYRIDQLYSMTAAGYATVGIQRTGTPAITDMQPIDFHVQQFNVGKK